MSLLRVPRARSLLLAAVLAVFASLAATAAHAYTDLLWFAELGSEDVYWTTLRWKLVAYGVAGVGTAGIVLANLVIAERITGARGDAAAKLPRAQRRIAYPLLAIAAGIVSAKWQAPGAWSQLALWSGRSDFGVTDPLFHRDAGFFVFSLPLYQHIVAWLLATLAIAAAAARRGARPRRRHPARRAASSSSAGRARTCWCSPRSRCWSSAGATGSTATRSRCPTAARRAPATPTPTYACPRSRVLAWLSVVGAGILLAAAAGRLKLLPTAVTIGLALLATAAPGLVVAPARALRGAAAEAHARAART